jgi:holliday junction DNA helicase RuvA
MLTISHAQAVDQGVSPVSDPMIGRLTGRVLAQEADGGVVIDVSGVGYEVAVPVGTLGRARADDAGRVTLWVYTHVREDALALFGFADETERAAFRALLGVSNVGPKIAVAVLGALPAAELAHAVARRDLSALTRIPGIGKKIAERLLLELRDKLPAPGAAAPAAGGLAPRSPRDEPGAADRLRGALTGMGFKPSEADRAVSAIGDRHRDAPFEDLLREALALLAK